MTYKHQILEKLERYDNFHYLGTLGYPDEVRQYLTEIDIYALPTGMDTTPLSCREAMAMKKPIISTRVGGIPEMIYDKETGFLADEGDYQTWIESIKSLLNNKELAEKLGNNARELLLEKFNWDVVAKKFLVAAESVLQKRV